jgi:exo-beta-1,3-glucanase (GH17 family)
MKFQTVSAAIAAVALAIAASPAQSIGVCYDPDHVDSVTEATISADFQTIKEKGFDLVRTYITTYGSADLATLAIAQGLNVSLGVPYDNDSPDDTAAYVTAAINAASLSNGTARVVQIFVGNENLASVDTVPTDMVSYITQLQLSLPDISIGTVQRNTELLDSSRYSAISGLADLLSTCDVVGVNIQPVFTSNTEASAAIDLVTAEWEELQSDDWETLFPGLAAKLSITEAGWPTDGTDDGNTGSVDGAEVFYQNFTSWAAENLESWQAHYFQMFDISSASASAFDPYFGLLDADGNEKFSL